MGAPRARALCYNFGGALDFQAGAWDDAERSLRAAVELYRDVGSASGEALSLQRLGVLLTARGAVDEAQQILGDGVIVAERAAMRSHCLTRLHASMIRNRLAAGDRDGVVVSLEEGLEAARRHGKCVTCNALLLPEVVRAELELGAVDDAQRHLEQLLETAAQFDSRVWQAMAAQAEARVLVARGDCARAVERLELAREAFAAVGQPYEVARTLIQHAGCIEAAAPDAARALRDEAAAVFARLGAPGIE